MRRTEFLNIKCLFRLNGELLHLLVVELVFLRLLVLHSAELPVQLR